MSYEEKEFLVLKALFEKTKDTDVTAAKLAKLIAVPENDIYYIFKDFERKGWTAEYFVNTARITEMGVTALNKWDSIHAPTNPVSYTINVHGDNNSPIVQGSGNTQIIQTSNPDFDKSIRALLEIIRDSSILDEDKDELASELEAINKLANKEQTAYSLEKAKFRLGLLDTALKGADLFSKAAPYLPAIYLYFHQTFPTP
jgi:hypothetical protein